MLRYQQNTYVNIIHEITAHYDHYSPRKVPILLMYMMFVYLVPRLKKENLIHKYAFGFYSMNLEAM